MLRLSGILLAGLSVCFLGAQDAAKTELQGNWQAISMEASQFGKAPKEIVDKTLMKFNGDTVDVNGKVAKFKLHGNTTPKGIDIMPNEGPFKGKSVPGIYKVEKGQLTICVSNSETRPKSFDLKKGEKQTLIVLKKVKSE